MTYPLPTLTWEMSEQETFSSPTIFDILTSLNSIFTSASYWEVKDSSLASTGSSDHYLEVGPSLVPLHLTQIKELFLLAATTQIP